MQSLVANGQLRPDILETILDPQTGLGFQPRELTELLVHAIENPRYPVSTTTLLLNHGANPAALKGNGRYLLERVAERTPPRFMAAVLQNLVAAGASMEPMETTLNQNRV